MPTTVKISKKESDYKKSKSIASLPDFKKYVKPDKLKPMVSSKVT